MGSSLNTYDLGIVPHISKSKIPVIPCDVSLEHGRVKPYKAREINRQGSEWRRLLEAF